MSNLINFDKMAALIPADGFLTLQFMKKGHEIIVLFKPAYPEDKKVHDSEVAKALSPVTLRGTAEELTAEFETAVTPIVALCTELVAIKEPVHQISPRKALNDKQKLISATIAAKKQKIEKAAASGDADKGKSEKDDKGASAEKPAQPVVAKEEKKELPEEPRLFDFFYEKSAVQQEVATSPVQPAVEPEVAQTA